MNDLITQKFGPIAKVFADRPTENNLASGIQASFPILGFAGKIWQLRYRGERQQFMRPDGDGPVNGVEVVILKAAGVVSKTYYENSYVDGSVEAPDCFSTNGITPEPTSKKLQSNACATCRHNAWGSRPPAKPGDAPRKGKACADTKRLAVALASQLLDGTAETIGPMLLRIPPASLQDVAMYGTAMAKYGYPEYSVITRISFDPKEVFPKLIFGATRALTEDEAKIVLALRESEQTDRVLAERDDEAAAMAQPETVAQSPFTQAGSGEQWVMTPAGTQTAPKPEASPAAPQSQQTLTQPTVETTVSTTQPSMTGGVSSGSAPTVVPNGSQEKTSGSPPAPAAASTAQPEQPFVNTGGTATFAGTPVSSGQAPTIPSGATSHGTNGAAPSTGEVATGSKNFEQELEDKLAALLPS